MSGYYINKIRFFSDIDSVVYNLVQKSKETKKQAAVSLAELELKYSLKYGFSRSAIVKRLKIHEDLGSITITESEVKTK